MTAVVEFGGGALVAIIAILATVIILALIVTRIARGDIRVRIARIGVFVERQRLGDLPPPDEPDPDVTQEWPRRRDPPV
jgi:hypothetical protein